MTNEQRIAEYERLADQAKKVTEASRAMAALPDCGKCRWQVGPLPGQRGGCKNPIVKLKHQARYGKIWIDINELRRSSGICGPDALLWERRWWWPFIRLARALDTASQRA